MISSTTMLTRRRSCIESLSGNRRKGVSVYLFFLAFVASYLSTVAGSAGEWLFDQEDE